MAQKFRNNFGRARIVGDAGCHSFAGWQRIARLRTDLKAFGGKRAAEALSGVPARHFAARTLGCSGVRFATFANACEALGLSVVVLPTVADAESKGRRWVFTDTVAESKPRG